MFRSLSLYNNSNFGEINTNTKFSHRPSPNSSASYSSPGWYYQIAYRDGTAKDAALEQYYVFEGDLRPLIRNLDDYDPKDLLSTSQLEELLDIFKTEWNRKKTCFPLSLCEDIACINNLSPYQTDQLWDYIHDSYSNAK